MSSGEAPVLRRFEAFLSHAIGLEASSLGENAVAQAVRQRCEDTDTADLEAYWTHLCVSTSEQQQLIEALVVHETWFFRDREALAALVARACAPARLTDHTALLRILSVPCSTGEEPYSIAMALLDAGLPAERFAIEGVDISERAIAYARRGLYGKNSFRGSELSFRKRHFQPLGSAFQVSEAVRRTVQFRRANLFAEGAFAPDAAYQTIYCRNVLIYFDAAARQRAFSLLHRLLTPEGVLFVGPAEAALLTDSPFTPARIPMAFAFYRADAAPKPAVRRSAGAHKPAQAWKPPTPSAASLVRSVPALHPPVVVPTPLEQARQLADSGRFEEAMGCCEQHLRGDPHSVEGHYLAGLISDAAGQSARARDYYRRALYLDPSHYEALIHLAETLRSTGDTQGAQQLLERARRAQSRGRTA